MSTRGIVGFRINGKDKFTYNHSDSYPDYLGENVLKDLKKLLRRKYENVIKDVTNLVAIDENVAPTLEQKRKLIKYHNYEVNNRSLNDWYCLLRETQGQILDILKCGIYIDNKSFIYDSLFCEWAYVINFDTKEFEIYKGFQTSKGKGRYNIKKEENEYYGCSLIKKYSFNELPKNLKELYKD